MPGMDGRGPLGTGPIGRGLGPCGGGRPRRGQGFGWRVLAEKEFDSSESLAQRKAWLEQQLAEINSRLQEIKKPVEKPAETKS